MSAALGPWLQRWGLELEGSARRPGGREAYPGTGDVAFVRRAGRRLVLKLLPDHADEGRSGEVLAHWDGHGAVRLIDSAPGAVLIERAVPGEDLVSLVAAGRDDEAAGILCETMARLNRPPPAPATFRTIADWGRGFARNRPAALALGVDPRLIDRAEGLFQRLCETQAAPIVLHGDLQHYNVVRDARRGWLAIDPKGVLGEPAYETGAMLRNPVDHPALVVGTEIIDRRARLIADRLGHDYGRIVRWCFSQWVLSVLWAIEDGLAYEPAWLVGPHAAEALL